MIDIYDKEESSLHTWWWLWWTKSLSPLIAHVWGLIRYNILIRDCEQNRMAEFSKSKLVQGIFKADNHNKQMKSFISKAKDVIKLGKEFISKEKYIHAIVAFYAVFKLHQQNDGKDESVEGIWTCFREASIVTLQLLVNGETKDIGQNHVIPLIQDINDFLRNIHGPSQLAEQMETKSKQFITEKKFIPAMVTLNIAAKLHKEINAGDDWVRSIVSCIEQISFMMEKMIKRKQTNVLSHVISHMDEMTEFSQISNYRQLINEIESKAKKFESEEKYIASVVSFYVAAKLHKLNNKGYDSVNGIQLSVQQILLLVKKMTKQDSMKKIVLDHVIPLLHEIKKFLQMIQGSSNKVRALCEVWSSFDIGLCYYHCDEYQEYANINEIASKFMKIDFAAESQTYRIYGSCLHSAGVAYSRMGNIEKAIELYKLSLEAKTNAEDFTSDKEKNDSIEQTRKNLKIAESMLPK
ncbi:uncharacterized protein LOC144411893 [Styela clava]